MNRHVLAVGLCWLLGAGIGPAAGEELAASEELAGGLARPPDSARPWVYWFWMDGNLSREGITADLEAMERAGLGGAIIMEVDVGIPKGPVRFMSPEWREMFKHVAAEAARLGLEIDMNASPGWTGSGGPWIVPEQSMQKLVASETSLAGPRRFEGPLPQPRAEHGFYRDVAALAFPAPAGEYRIGGIQEKALYRRGHYSSERGVRAFFPAPARHAALPPEQVIPMDRVVDLTARLDQDGRLSWDVPEGQWTVIRFGQTSTGANTRPAPEPGLGLECDKLDPAALEAHFNEFIGRLIADIGPLAGKSLVSLHIDSWEMGPQNWTLKFRVEFQRLRGYDPLRWLPVLTGRVVDSLEVSERFLWDWRQAVSELIRENYAGRLRALAHRHGLRLSIQPYDGTPCDDMTYGARADVPMCEFWANCFDTFFSCTEACSVAHAYGKRIVAAEAFTSDDQERWLFHPGSMKALGDWALCQGINRFVFHRYAHQPWLDRWPGMTMGPYGVHYERTQTWWEQAEAWHRYLARCQFLLQRGLFVADICYLAPEGAPHVFRPPESATRGRPPDRLGYNFDGCTPEALLERLSVQDGRLVLPDGMSYRILVLPRSETMTPRLLRKIKELVEAGATVVGPPPLESPSLSGYPKCDEEVKRLADELWGAGNPAVELAERPGGKGRVIWGTGLEEKPAVAPEPESPLGRARWIWLREGNPAAAAPVGKRFFRRILELDADRRMESARVIMTADNAFELWVNGRRAGAGDDFTRTFAIEVAPLLKPGANLVAVAAKNGGDGPNPAGLIGALEIRYRDGGTLAVLTDREWEAAPAVKEGWTWYEAPGGGWGAAMELGPLGMAPWGAIDQPSSLPEIYPDHGAISALLAKEGVAPDFEADGNLRYTHRHEGETDIYFVAHGGDGWLGADGAFRVAGKIPELWDPVTGRIRKPAAYREKDGRTFLPLWLEPAGSVFVVFRKASTAAPVELKSDPVVAASRNGESLLPEPGRPLSEPPALELFDRQDLDAGLLAWQPGRYELKRASGKSERFEVPSLPPPLELTGPWEVRFQPRRGAPEKIRLDQLLDWSKHADEGVKHFSGAAVYLKTFDVPPSMLGQDSRPHLDLGQVQVMAQVKLNGRDLGVLWKPPFRVEVTGAVKPGENALEIRVVNLWPNRLIGDQSLPPEHRIAWSTWNPFQKDSPLLESGLLGPVTLRVAKIIRS